MGNAAAGGLELEAAEGREARNSVSAMSDPTLPLQKKQSSSPKLPMPPEEELEERFNVVLSYMNLPPDKLKLLSQYDNDKKWELVCDQVSVFAGVSSLQTTKDVMTLNGIVAPVPSPGQS
ncbi:formin-like protein 1 [Poecilia latipinna]|uniref:formin-like protein 1 n=1 Tax=Poecilia formosa TaxID=48698 RepID=UPI0004439671|nr:PREDICTED: formin-like protein 1 [Poecilia formosa]XP_014898446.1 PREDICTED: formin-like protein 1 [Poecilia latipinna]